MRIAPLRAASAASLNAVTATLAAIATRPSTWTPRQRLGPVSLVAPAVVTLTALLHTAGVMAAAAAPAPVATAAASSTAGAGAAAPASAGPTAAGASGAAASDAIIVATVAPDVVRVGRTVVKKFESVAQEDGDGARVRRSIGRPELPRLDPFLMLDYFDVRSPGGFPPHPHRGQSTVTYMVEGSFEHEDFKGHHGIIGPGDLQWMTAGRGIVHSELPHGGHGAGLQLWVNLPRSAKMVEPDYQELLAKDIPKVKRGGVTATVIAGKALGVESPVRTLHTPTSYLDFKLAPDAVLTQHIPAGWNAFIYVIEGSAVFGAELSATGDSTGATAAAAAGGASAGAGAASVAADGTTTEAPPMAPAAAVAAADAAAEPAVTGGKHSEAHHTLVLSNSGSEDGLVVKAGSHGVRFVLISGKPLKEPVQQYGPFVMTTHDEIDAAYRDYQLGRNGFEGARAFVAAWEARHGSA